MRCPECGQLVSQVSAERYWETMKQFDSPDFNQPSLQERERRFKLARRRLKRIAALLAKPVSDIRIVDVGCSRGQFVEFADRLGFDAEGVEPAPHIAAAALASGLKVHQGLLEEQGFPDKSFDAVTLFEVIEHLREPLSLLRECHRILKPRGILLVGTGNTVSWTVAAMKARWDYFHIAKDAGHISFYNPKSMQRLAVASGFAVERIETARVRFNEKNDVPHWLYVLSKVTAELLNLPARIAGKGHDMLAYLRRI